MVLLLAALCRAGDVPDEAVTYHFDLTREGDKAPTLLELRLPARIWQHGDHPPGWAPGSAVRKGWGSAFWHVPDPRMPGTAAHAYLEIEPLGGKSLRDAVADSLGNLSQTCEAAQHTLGRAPEKPKPYTKLKLGGKTVPAYLASYTVRPPAHHGPGEFRSEALYFELNGSLVTLAVDNTGSNEFFDLFAKGLGLAKGVPPDAETTFKLFHVDGGVSRFLSLRIPAGFRRMLRHDDGKLSALWERRDPTGTLTGRLSVAESWAHKQPLGEVMEKRAPAWRQEYEGFSGPVEVRVGDRAGFRIAFHDDGDAEARDVRAFHARLENQDYVITLETIGGDEKAVTADHGLFDRLLMGARIWRSRVP